MRSQGLETRRHDEIHMLGHRNALAENGWWPEWHSPPCCVDRSNKAIIGPQQLLRVSTIVIRYVCPESRATATSICDDIDDCHIFNRTGPCLPVAVLGIRWSVFSSGCNCQRGACEWPARFSVWTTAATCSCFQRWWQQSKFPAQFQKASWRNCLQL